MTDLVSCFREDVNDILEIRDDLGAQKLNTYILTRTWSGGKIGEGTPTDVRTQVLPSPRIVNVAHDRRLKEGGHFKSGDIVLKQISQQTYPTESEIDGTRPGAGIEIFYMVGDRLYTVVTVIQKQVTWSVHLRKHNRSKTYL